MQIDCHPGIRATTFLPRRARLPAPFQRQGVHLYLRGATALRAGLALLAFEPGDEILFPSYHCGIELDVLLRSGLRVRYYAVDPSLGIDLEAIRDLVRPTTKALYLIHYFGFPRHLEALSRLCADHDLTLIEDCAQGLYGNLSGRALGTFGRIAIFSMRKTLPLPCGGALFVNDPTLPQPESLPASPVGALLRESLTVLDRSLAHSSFGDRVLRRGLLRQISWTATKIRRSLGGHVPARAVSLPVEYVPARYEHAMAGLSRWMFRRARHDQVPLRRRAHYRFLLEITENCRRVRPVIHELDDGVCPVYFPVLPAGDGADFIAHCRAHGVWAVPNWLHLHPRFPSEQFPEVAWMKRQFVALPVHQDLSRRDLQRIECALRAWDR